MNHRISIPVLALLFPAPVLAATLSVDPAGGGDSVTIQGAIDLAADGDTIEVMPGTYAEAISFEGKDIAVVSTGGSSVTTITSSGDAPAVMIESNEGTGVVFEGFTLFNDGGVALFVNIVVNPTITDVRVVGGGGADVDGAAIFFDDGDPTFSNIVISGVTALNAPFYINDGDVTITGLDISDCTATYSGAMFVGLASVAIEDATFSRNKASDRAGGIWVDRVALTIRDFLFDANTTDGLGPMAYVSDGSDVVLEEGVISGHSTTGSSGVPGGALWLEPGANLDATSVTFSANTGIVAGALTAFGANTVSLDGCAFTGNSAIAGGAIVGYGTELTVTGTNFDGNSSLGLGGAVLCQAGCSVDIEGSSFSGNWSTAEQGGGLALQTPIGVSLTDVSFARNTAELEGGGLYLSDAPGTVQITGGSYDGNVSAAMGGGVYAELVDLLVFDGVSITSNESVTGGGGIYAIYDTSLTLQDVVAEGNTTGNGHGGAVELARASAGSLVANDSVFRGNTTMNAGAGVHAREIVSVTVERCLFEDNVAAAEGGGLRTVALSGGRLVSNTTFCGNSGTGGGAIASEGILGADVIENSAFVSNEGTTHGGALFTFGDPDTVITNVAFLANTSPTGAAVSTIAGGGATISNAVFAYQTGSPAIYVEGTITATYSDFWDNEGDAGGALSDADVAAATGNLAVEPLFVAWSDDGDCANDDLVPASGSPLVDAGDPALLDFDGTRSDIGPWAGPGSDVYDGDGDGVWNNSDCDDADEDVFPGALDVPYDTIDQDCDGADLTDVDGDGHDAIVAGGLDCDDEDQTVYPGAVDAWYDGIDSDCAGDNDYDQDQDGVLSDAHGGEDCDDLDAAVNPFVAEVWYDGTDQDCDGNDDDQDGDGHGLADDCDDTDATLFGVDACDPVDTDVPEDTDQPEDTDTDTGEGCKCGTPGLAFGGVWPLLAAFGMVRRRR